MWFEKYDEFHKIFLYIALDLLIDLLIILWLYIKGLCYIRIEGQIRFARLSCKSKPYWNLITLFFNIQEKETYLSLVCERWAQRRDSEKIRLKIKTLSNFLCIYGYIRYLFKNRWVRMSRIPLIFQCLNTT